MVVVLTYWLSYEYVRDPRKALEPESAGAALLRGAFHVLSLLAALSRPGAARAPARRWSALPTTADATDNQETDHGQVDRLPATTPPPTPTTPPR